MKNHGLIGLEDIRLCAWPTASLARDEVAGIRAVMTADPEEAATITTCQRIEILSVGLSDCPGAAPVSLRGREALVHLAEVAAGLHSVVLGEPQVLGQVRTGLAHAPAPLRRYADVALAAARELRRRESFSMHSGHLLDRGLAAAERPSGGRLLVLGAGHMGRLVAARGLDLGFDDVLIAARTEPQTAPTGARYIPLHDVASLGRVQVIAGCLGASAPEIDARHGLPEAEFLLDLGTPRNFDPESHPAIITLATLLRGVDAVEATRRAALSLEVARLLDRRLEMMARDSGSAVGMLRREVERVRHRESARIRRLHPEIPPEKVEAITRSLVNQIFHLPAERLRGLEDSALRDRIVELFLGEDEAEAETADSHLLEPAAAR
jgi:glutamyl-tRNA reductase